MNVEVCVSRVGSIKYLFKYVCKGSDRVTVQFQEDGRDVNEIDRFIDARYISASEAAWRITRFEIVTKNPRLYVLKCIWVVTRTCTFEKVRRHKLLFGVREELS